VFYPNRKGNEKSGFSFYVLASAISVMVIIFSNSIANGLTSIVLFSLLGYLGKNKLFFNIKKIKSKFKLNK